MLTEKDKKKLSWYQSFVDQQGWPSYEEAKKEVQEIGFKSIADYKQNRPPHLPSTPEQVYKKEWKNWGEFLGIENIRNREWPSYEEAKKEVQGIGFKRIADYLQNRPSHLPSDPERVYSEEWKGWGEYLGTGNVRTKNFLEYEEAKKEVQEIGFESITDYQQNRPSHLPSDPHRVYSKEWISWIEFLGTKKEWPSYEETKKEAQKIGFKNSRDYWQNRPSHLPSHPQQVYKDEWEGWGIFLGTRNIRNKEWPSYEETKKEAQGIGFKRIADYRQNRPSHLPSDPERVYSDEWEGWKVFLGKV
jgi:hypothetical protein